jgi:predicted RNA-binding protein with PIN domain
MGRVRKLNKYLLIDGYNIINAWPDLREIALINFEEARERLIQQFVDYKFYTGEMIIIVFDAHSVKQNHLKREYIDGIEVVFTKEYQTADSYIEKKVEELTKKQKK